MTFRHPTKFLFWSALPFVRCLVQAPSGLHTITASELDSEELSQTIRMTGSQKFLVASMPNLHQVAYVHLPDNVWRPFVLGDIGRPTAVAVDSQHARLFVSDPTNSRILWYQLMRGANGGILETGPRRAAVEGYNASWLAVNAQGDLYFTGHMVSELTDGSIDSIFRQDAANIVAGYSTNPTEVYSRFNSGNPTSRVWMPSGLSVDSFNIYWGNQEAGTTHGSVVRGSRQNLGAAVSSDAQIMELSTQMDQVGGVTATGTHIFWLAPDGVYGLTKSTAYTITDPSEGRVALAPPGDSNGASWTPRGIAWDGDSTIYISDASEAGRGKIYSAPSLNLAVHNLTKFVDVPGIYDIAVMDFSNVFITDRVNSAFAHHVALLPGVFLLALFVAAL